MSEQTATETSGSTAEAVRMVDAIVRTLIRLFITRRLLLEWTTAASARIVMVTGDAAKSG